MRVAIIGKSGPAAGRRYNLRGGQVAKIGKTDWADFSFPEDSSLADIHFAIHCGITSVVIESLSESHETIVNDKVVSKCLVRHADTVAAGNCLFQFEIDDVSEPLSNIPTTAAVTNIETHENANEAFEISEYIGLSPDAIDLAKTCTSAKKFGAQLVEANLINDAIRWRAHTLPKNKSVQWAILCVEELMKSEPSPVQLSAFAAAKQWAADPTEENRVQALESAKQSKYEGIGGALAAAAGWSGGSLGPATVPDIPPDDRLTARSVYTALSQASYIGPPKESLSRLKGFLEVGSSDRTTKPSS